MNEISIRIFWGPWGGEFNPSPIVSVGNVVGGIVPSAPALVKEDKSWMIKTDEWKAVYACHSKERCFNSDSYMQLLVCVIIPKGKRLAGEKSPLDLLEDVRSQFDQFYTIDLDANQPVDVDAAFSQLLAGYAVEDCHWYVFNMEGDKPASFCVENRSQLNALMRYNAYPTLAHIEYLELGFKCKTTVNIDTRGQSGSGKKKETKSKWWWNGAKEKEPKDEQKNETKKESAQELVKEKPMVVEKPKEENHVINENPQNVERKSNDTTGFRIALYIGGTRFRYSGFGFIMGVGVLAGNEHEGDMMDIVPVSRASTDENPIITIKNADGYVLYKLWDDSIETCDMHGKGRLAIGITVPFQARLKDNKSPFRLLMDVYEKFLEIGTEKTIDGFRFRDVKLEKAEFAKIIENYPLEVATVKTAVMRGDAIGEIQVPREKMEDFFRDTQYPEFVGYKAVEVSSRGRNMFPGLSIPKMPNYEIHSEKAEKDEKDEKGKKRKTKGQAFEDAFLSLLAIVLFPFYGIYKLVKKMMIKSWPSMLILGLLVGLGVGTFYIVKSTRESKDFKSCETAYDYKAFLEKYPNSKYREAASFYSCNAIDQYRHYLNEYSQGAFSHTADSIVEEYVRDSTARREKAEQDAYERCMVKDTINAFNACMDYLNEFEQGNRWDEVNNLKNKLQMSYFKKDYAAYQNCLDKKQVYKVRKQICDSYFNLFKYGKYAQEMQAITMELAKECSEERYVLLDALNRGEGYKSEERYSFIDAKDKGCLDKEEYGAATWLVNKYGVRTGYVYKRTNKRIAKVWNDEQVVDYMENEMEKMINPYKDGNGFKFQSWDEVTGVCKNVLIKMNLIIDSIIDNSSREDNKISKTL